MSSSDLEAAARNFLDAAEKALRDGSTAEISEKTVQCLLTAGTRLYANKSEMEETFFNPFVEPVETTATDVVVTVSEMLRAVNLNTFDLTMWFRRPRPEGQ